MLLLRADGDTGQTLAYNPLWFRINEPEKKKKLVWYNTKLIGRTYIAQSELNTGNLALLLHWNCGNICNKINILTYINKSKR